MLNLLPYLRESNMSAIFVMKLDDLPEGKMHCQDLEGNNILFANVEGNIYAVSGMCTHEDSPLCLGALKGNSVMCSLHGSFFDLRTGEADGDPADIPLKTYTVNVDGDSIFVQL